MIVKRDEREKTKRGNRRKENTAQYAMISNHTIFSVKAKDTSPDEEPLIYGVFQSGPGTKILQRRWIRIERFSCYGCDRFKRNVVSDAEPLSVF